MIATSAGKSTQYIIIVIIIIVIIIIVIIIIVIIIIVIIIINLYEMKNLQHISRVTPDL